MLTLSKWVLYDRKIICNSPFLHYVVKYLYLNVMSEFILSCMKSNEKTL